MNENIKKSVIRKIIISGALLFLAGFFSSNAEAATKTKTVEFFIGQNQTSGAGVAANTFWSPTAVTIDLPDAITSASAIKSAWIDYTFQTAATTAPGVVTIGLTPSGMSETTFTSASYLASGENYTIRVKPDFTAAVSARFSSAGAYSFSFRARVAGAARKMESAKLFITYDYDDQATTQLNTVKYRIGQSAGNVAVGATGVTFNSPNLSISESSPVIVSAWAEIRGEVPATGTTDNTFAINYDADSVSNYFLDNVGGTNSQTIYILHPKNNITLNATHTLKVAATAGYQMNMVSAEQVITYKFNYTNSTTLTKTREIILGSEGNRASSTPLEVTDSINIPEDSHTFRNIYLRGTAHSDSSSAYNLAANLGASSPTPTKSFNHTVSTETLGNYWILSDDVGNLSSMVKGDNQISATFQGTMTSRAMQAVLTYSYDKTSQETAGAAAFWVEQQTSYGNTGEPAVNIAVAGTTKSGSWDSYVWANSVNGVTQNRNALISVQPTAVTTYNWNSTGEYQWIVFFHRNISGEIIANGSYVVNLNSSSNSNNVMAAVVGTSWIYPAPAGSLSVDIVDLDSQSVPNPSVDFTAATFNWNAQQSTAVMGIAGQTIVVVNQTASPLWTLSLSATDGPGSRWTDGAKDYDFNDSAMNGRLRVDPSTIGFLGPCESQQLSKGSAQYFDGSNEVVLVTAGASVPFPCYWLVTGISLTQDIPAAQESGNYSIGMTLTIL